MTKYKKVWESYFGPVIKGFHIHHIIPRSLGGGDNIGNLIALHPEDHLLIHKMRGDKFAHSGFISVKGASPSPEARAKISKTLTGRKLSKETCRLMSKARTGRANSSFDHTEYLWYHKEHGEVISNRYDLGLRFGTCSRKLGELIREEPNRKSHLGWSLIKE